MSCAGRWAAALAGRSWAPALASLPRQGPRRPARRPQAAADWGKLAHLPYAAHLLASEPGQAILQKAAGLSADALRGILAWRVRRRGARALGAAPERRRGRLRKRERRMRPMWA